MLSQTLGQSFAVFVTVATTKYICQAHMKGVVHQAFEAPGKGFPFLRVVAQRNLLDLAQQVHDTLLLGKRPEAIVGAEEVGDQDTVEKRTQDLLDYGSSPRRSQDIVGQSFAGETPDPSGSTSDAPTAFVHVEHGQVFRLLSQKLIGRNKQLCQPLPVEDQAPRCDLELAKGSQPSTDVASGHAQAVMQIGRQQRKPQSHGSSGKRLGQGCRYFPSARSAAVFIDDMLSDHGPDLGDILNNPNVLAARLANRILTERAFAQPMLHGFINLDWNRTPATTVAILATWLAAALANRWFAVNGSLGRRGRQRDGRLRRYQVFDLSLKFVVLLFQFCDFLLGLFALLPQKLFQLFLFSLQSLLFLLQTLNFPSLFFKKRTKTTLEIKIARSAFSVTVGGYMRNHPLYSGSIWMICPVKSCSVG